MTASAAGSTSRISREKWKVKNTGRKSNDVAATENSARRIGRDARTMRRQ